MAARWRERLALLWTFRGSPHELALAFALGVALGILPGTGAVAAAVCASILRVNVPLAIAGALLTNPVTTPFLYLTGYLLGRRLLGGWPSAPTAVRLIVHGLIGCTILAVAAGVVAYVVVRIMAAVLHRARR